MPDDVRPRGYDPDGATVPWSAFYAEARQRLGPGCDLEARRIVERASGHEGADFHLGLEQPASVRGVAHFDAMLERRLQGEPLQYVLGSWGFRHLDLLVDERVLIPRPETEIVVGIALAELERVAVAGRELVAVDLGTGSGAIGLSLAVERDDTVVTLTDVSGDALQVARANLTGIGRAATRVTIAEGSWFGALPEERRGELDLIVSNPPYVALGDELPAEVADWEPTGALIAADEGRADLDHLIAGAAEWLAPAGALVLEMAPHQTEWAASTARGRGYADVQIMPDLAGRDRALRARWPG